MVEVVVNEGKLTLGVPLTSDSFARSFEFPLENIAGAEVDHSLAPAWFKRLEFMASYLPAVKKPGTYYEDANCIFWEIEDPNSTIVISLRNEPHEKLIVGVANPQLAVETIENVLKGKEAKIEELDVEATGS